MIKRNLLIGLLGLILGLAGATLGFETTGPTYSPDSRTYTDTLGNVHAFHYHQRTIYYTTTVGLVTYEYIRTITLGPPAPPSIR